MDQLMPLPLTVSCFSKIQIGFTFPVPAHLGSPGKGPLNVRVCYYVLLSFCSMTLPWRVPLQCLVFCMPISVSDIRAVNLSKNRKKSQCSLNMCIVQLAVSKVCTWSSNIVYQLPPSTTIHSIHLVQFTCLTVFSTISLYVRYDLITTPTPHRSIFSCTGCLL